MIKNKLFLNTLAQYKIGLWQLGDQDTNEDWSDLLLSLFGCTEKNFIPSLEHFTEHILHPDDITFLKFAIPNTKTKQLTLKTRLELKTILVVLTCLIFFQ